MLTIALLLLAPALAQDAPPEPAEEAPAPPAAGEETEEAPAEGPEGPPPANPPPPPPAQAAESPQPGPKDHAMRRQHQQRMMAMHGKKRCEQWEIAVWNPRKSGCAGQPDALGDEWCPVPDGMTPIQPVGDTLKWWVKRCADPTPEPPAPGG